MTVLNGPTKEKRITRLQYLIFSLSEWLLDIQQLYIEKLQHQTDTYTTRQLKLGKKKP